MKRLILILVAVVLVGSAGVAAIWFGAGRDLQGPSVAFLMACKDGRFQEAYEATDERFRAARTLAEFEALWRHWEGEHGVFGEVIRRLSVEPAPAGEAWDESLTLDLGFRDGHVIGRFFYRMEGEEPRLVHASMERRRKVTVPASDRSRLEATSKRVLGLFAEDKLLSLYDAFAPELQMRWTQTRMLRELTTLRGELGALKTVVRTAGPEDLPDDARGPRVSFSFDLTFEEVSGVSHVQAFDVTHRHALGRWSVVGFEAR